MGNWLGKKQVVHPLGHEPLRNGWSGGSRSNSSVRIKVRMSARELKEWMAQVDPSKLADSEQLGGLILQECSRGRWVPRVVVGQNRVTESTKGPRYLGTIRELDSVDDS
ncbi:hypothetical protein Acr_07g0003720 [Actinidia rufa]|uniref:Uncharacterized protein n=1 Tax=Actinidia rufa TaxID=165716 RepID=A0A7J0EUJ9_9ERIC|nr:hypothetical protein Acr_07g0003720 [Actinidia rufa]